MADFLAELNPAQLEAVEAIGGPVLILAGPGSGAWLWASPTLSFTVS